jgi:hypothetical protein
MELHVIERVGCSWLNDNRETSDPRSDFASSAAFHDAPGDDFTKCDSCMRLWRNRYHGESYKPDGLTDVEVISAGRVLYESIRFVYSAARRRGAGNRD